MKTIKLFEEFSNKLFTKISNAEWDEYSKSKNLSSLEAFTQNELDSVINLKLGFTSRVFGPFGYPLSKYPDCKNLTVLNIKNSSLPLVFSNNVIYSIYKLPDEWYYIHDKSNYDDESGIRYYKCDTFEGVIQCLKHICNRIYNL